MPGYLTYKWLKDYIFILYPTIYPLLKKLYHYHNVYYTPLALYLQPAHMKSKQRNKENEREFVVVFFFFFLMGYSLLSNQVQIIRSDRFIQAAIVQYTDPV